MVQTPKGTDLFSGVHEPELVVRESKENPVADPLFDLEDGISDVHDNHRFVFVSPVVVQSLSRR